MRIPHLPVNEQERLSAVNSYDILDTLPEADFDHLTKIASEICQTPISLITIIDQDRQWFKSRLGIDDQETPRDLAFCAHAILDPGEIMVVPDAHKDERFFDNPYVTGAPYVNFYAGVPLVTEGGHSLGTLCVIDNQPKELTPQQKESLKALGQQAVRLIELRKKNKELEDSKKALDEINKQLEHFAYVVAHDLKSPCNNLIMLSELINETYSSEVDDEGKQMLGFLTESSNKLRALVDDILLHSKTAFGELEKEKFSFSELMDDVLGMITLPASFQVELTRDDSMLYASKISLLQILSNLCSNAIKYHDKPQGLISVSFSQDKSYYHFSVKDNGMGIPASQCEKIFDLFHTLGVKDRFSNTGTGIGLNTVKKLVERSGGQISVVSEAGKGSVFSFTIKK